MLLPNTILALLLTAGPILPLAAAQQIRYSPTGCLVERSEHVADAIACGSSSSKSVVLFAVEWHGADPRQLRSWLEVAGCTEDEAEAEALRAAERCRLGTTATTELGGAEEEGVGGSSSSGGLELRNLRRRARRFFA